MRDVGVVYYEPNRDFAKQRAPPEADLNILQAFSEACRKDRVIEKNDQHPVRPVAKGFLRELLSDAEPRAARSMSINARRLAGT